MFCWKCGHQNTDEAKFCGKCGAASAVSTTMKVGISIATLIVPPIGIIMGLIYMKDLHHEKKSVGRLWLWIGVGASIIYLLNYV